MYTLTVAMLQCRTVSMNSIKVLLVVFGFRRGVDGNWIATRVSREISSGGYSTQVDAETSNLQARPEQPVPPANHPKRPFTMVENQVLR